MRLSERVGIATIPDWEALAPVPLAARERMAAEHAPDTLLITVGYRPSAGVGEAAIPAEANPSAAVATCSARATGIFPPGTEYSHLTAVANVPYKEAVVRL
jgi:hypothetical protein